MGLIASHDNASMRSVLNEIHLYSANGHPRIEEAGLFAPLQNQVCFPYFIASSNISATCSQFTKWSKNAFR
jgi:hypothetical protein